MTGERQQAGRASPRRIGGIPGQPRQKGALIVALMMLMIISMLGISATHIALTGEKLSRNDRDRHIAFEAAEAALKDAELDIENSPDIARSRSHLFSKHSAIGFPEHGGAVCNGDATGIYLGLCRGAEPGVAPAWQTVNFLEDGLTASPTVPYGQFTGQTFPVGSGSLPSRLPRYIIELFHHNRPGESADKPTYFFRVTAVGFGARDSTQVALQSFYYKDAP